MQYALLIYGRQTAQEAAPPGGVAAATRTRTKAAVSEIRRMAVPRLIAGQI